MKRGRRKKSKVSFKKGIFALFAFLVLLFFSKNIYIKSTSNPVLETNKTEVQKIPKEIKEKLPKELTLNASIKVPILMYHYVEFVKDKKDKTRESLNITPDVFEEQVKTLTEAGYTFMTAAELGQVLDGKKILPKKPVLLTFDDGHWDLDTDVLPILKKYNAKATAYIISGFLGQSDFLSPFQLKDVIESHIVEIGSHTVDHIALKDKFLFVVNNELEESKKELEKNYNIKVVSFAYPFGSFDQQAADSVKKAGYETAVSTVPGDIQSISNRYFLFRIRPGYRTGQELVSYLNSTEFTPYGESLSLNK